MNEFTPLALQRGKQRRLKVNEMPECYSETWRKARREHQCEECGTRIVPGESYRAASGIWDGRAATHKQCAECATVWDWAQSLPDVYPEEGPCFGGLVLWLKEWDGALPNVALKAIERKEKP